MKKICRKCGSELDVNWMACPKCGEESNFEEVHPDEKEEVQDGQEENEAGLTQKLGRVLKMLILIVIICFFCPMYMVSCGAQEVASLSGVDLTFGFTVATEEVEGNLVFSLLALLPIVAFVALLKIKNLNKKTEDGREEIRQRFYVCGACMTSTLLFELYFFATIQSTLEENMISYEAMGACYIMRIVAFAAMGLATYQAHLFEPNEKEGELLSQRQKLLRSIKNVAIIALVMTIIIIAIYSWMMSSFDF